MLGRRQQALLVVALAMVLAVLYFAVAGFREGIQTAASILARGDVTALRDYLLSFGIWAPAVSSALMVLQSIAAPLPAFVITFANGMLFGAFWGALVLLGSG